MFVLDAFLVCSVWHKNTAGYLYAKMLPTLKTKGFNCVKIMNSLNKLAAAWQAAVVIDIPQSTLKQIKWASVNSVFLSWRICSFWREMNGRTFTFGSKNMMKQILFVLYIVFWDRGRKTGDPCGGVIRLLQSFVVLEGSIEVMDNGFRFDLSCFKDLFYPPLDGLKMQ